MYFYLLSDIIFQRQIFLIGVDIIKLINILNKTSILKGGTSTGVYIDKDKYFIIDPGLSLSRGFRIAKFFNENNIYPSYILITHGHKDHYEAAISLKKIFPKSLILASSDFIIPEFKIDMYFSEIQSFSDFENFIFIPLPGHTKCSTGIITPDKVLFLGDVLISKKLLKKYPDTPIENIDEHRLSIKKIYELDFQYAVIGHSKNIFSKKELIELCQFNLKNLKNKKKGCL